MTNTWQLLKVFTNFHWIEHSISVHLFTMIKKGFYSQLFKRFINKTKSDYTAIVKAELLFRIRELKKRTVLAFSVKLILKSLRITMRRWLILTRNFNLIMGVKTQIKGGGGRSEIPAHILIQFFNGFSKSTYQ